MKKSTLYAFFDIGNSAYIQIVIAFVIPPYFAKYIVGDVQLGAAYWQWTAGAVGFLVAMSSPFLGGLADHLHKGKIKFLIISTLCTILISLLFWFSEANSSFIIYTLIIFFLSNYFFEISNCFYNSLLRESSSKERLGRTSSLGFCLGYLGIVPLLLFCLFAFIKTDQPIFDLQKENFENIRFIPIVISFWFLLFSLPMMIRFYNYNPSDLKLSPATSIFFDIKKIIWNKKITTTGRFLLARMFYADGIVVIQTGGGLYAVGVLNFTPQELLYLVIVGNAFAGLITYFGGFLIDKYECKKIIMWSIFGIMVGILIIGFAQSKIHFFGAAMLVAGFIGPLQSASRVLMAKIIPAANQGVGFGLYGLSSKATAFLGPVLVGTLTFYISQRVGFVSILILFLISLWMLWKLDLD